MPSYELISSKITIQRFYTNSIIKSHLDEAVLSFHFLKRSKKFYQLVSLLLTGGVMPQNGTSYGDTRRRIHHLTCKSSHHGPSARWLNGVIHSGCQAATTGTSDGTCPHSSVPISLPRLVDGMASAADRVSSAEVTGGVTANGATSSDSVMESCNTNQSCPEPSLAVGAKKRRRRKKFPPKKR